MTDNTVSHSSQPPKMSKTLVEMFGYILKLHRGIAEGSPATKDVWLLGHYIYSLVFKEI